MTNTTGPGWYPDGQGVTRWWDGRQWTQHTQQGQAVQQVQPRGRQPIDELERAAILNAEVARAAHNGWSVQSVSQGQAVLAKNNRIGWFWNTVLAVITFGIWLIVIIYRVVNRKQQTMIISVDAYGKVSRR